MARDSLKAIKTDPNKDNARNALAQTALNPADKATTGVQQLPNVVDLELDGNARSIRAAQDELIRQDTLPAEVEEPGFLDILGAAFRQENVVVNAFMRATEDTKDDATPLSPEQLFEKAKSDGLDPYMDALGGSLTVGEYETRKERLNGELEDRKIMAAASTATGLGTSMVAGVLDVTSLIPFGAGVKAAKTGFGVVRSVAGAAAADAATSEIALQGFQTQRTATESVSAVALSAVLGGAIGAGAAGLSGKFGSDIADIVDTRAVEAQRYANAPPGSAGAAANLEAYDKALRFQDPRQSKLNVPVFDAPVRWLDNIPGWVGDKLRNPYRTLELDANSPASREFAGRLTTNPRITDLDAEGEVLFKGTTVTTEFGKKQGEFADVVSDVEAAWSGVKDVYTNDRKKFGKDLMQSIVTGKKHELPAVEKLAGRVRKFFEDFRQDQIKAGVFTEDTQVRNAENYAPIVHDVKQILERPDEFLEMEFRAIRKEMEDEFVAAKTQHAKDKAEAQFNREGIREARQAEIEDINEELKSFDASTQGQIDELKFRAEGEINDVRLELEKVRQSNARIAQESGDEVSELATLEADTKANYSLEILNKMFDVNLAEVAGLPTERLTLDIAALKKAEKARLKEIRAAKSDAVASRNTETSAASKRAEDAAKDIAKKITAIRTKTAAAIKRRTTKNKASRAELVKTLDTTKAELEASLSELRTATKKPDLLNKTQADLDADARAAAKSVFDTLTGNKKRYVDRASFGQQLSQYRKGRTNPVQHAEMIERGFVKDDVLDLMEFYTRSAGSDLALAKVFRKLDPDGNDIGPDLNLTSLKQRISDDHKVLLDNVQLSRSQKTKAAKLEGDARTQYEQKTLRENFERLNAQKARSINSVDTLIDMMRGRNPGTDPYAQGWNETAEMLGVVNFLRLMGGTVVSSLGDPINIVISNGLGRTLRDGLAPIIRRAKLEKVQSDLSTAETRKISRLLMQNVEREFNKTVMDIADLGNPLERGSAQLNTMRKLSNNFSQFTGIQGWNSMWKQIAARTIQGRVLDDATEGWDKLSRVERAWLTNNRITKTDLDAIRDAWNAQPVQHLPDGGKWPKFDEWPEGARDAFFRVNMAEAHNNVIAPQFTDKMAMSATPMGRLVGQFRQHMLANQVRLLRRQVQFGKLDSEYAARVYTGMFALAAMGVVVDFMKHEIGHITLDGTAKSDTSVTPGEKWINDFGNNPVKGTYNALDRSGVMGILGELNNMSGKLTGDKVSVQSALNGILGLDDGGINSRYINRSPLDVLGGPSVGLLGDALTSSTALLDGEVTRAELKAMRRLAPFQNAPGIQQVLNEGEKQVGNIYGWD